MTAYQYIASNKRRSAFLLALFIIFIGFLGWVFAMWTDTGYPGLVIALILAIILSLTSFYAGDKVALATAGARPIKKEDNPYVYRLVENLCITAGIPMPKIYIINDPAPNAFATGRDPKHASIALTTGIIEQLENEELEGVIAHELSHIKNYDIRLMMLVIICVGIVTLLAHWFWRIRFFGGGRRGRGGGGGAAAILMIVGLVFLILSPIFAKLIQLAISRKREFLADASGVMLTRYPEGLARALKKISDYPHPLRHANQATAHLYILNPFGRVTKGFSNLFSTHPPIEQRIKALYDMGNIRE